MASSLALSHEPPYPDMFSGGTPQRVTEDNTRLKLLNSKWDEVQHYPFPVRYIGGRCRKLGWEWFNKNSWLRYSVSVDGAYCAPCFLFVGNDSKAKVLVSTPLTDWSNVSKQIGNHNKSDVHYSSMQASDRFVGILEGKSKDIACSLSSAYNSKVEKNRKILISIVEAIVFCGKQNIALRGHEDQHSNFQALLHFQAKHSELLRDHLEHADPCSRYTSPDIQNELITICGDMLVKGIVTACNQSSCFGFIADEATDAGTMEQMALCVRFWDSSSKTLREDFIGFVMCKSTTGEALSKAFLHNLEAAGVELPKMRGQGYDGAANMSGVFRGVQARVKAQIPGAVYTHCKAHCLNLAIVHASKETYARNIMDMVQTIAFAFNYSAKRLLCFRENIGPVDREEMNRRTKLQSLCETRWAARADALFTFLSSFTAVESSLHQLATEHGDTKAASYHKAILTFEFIISLIAVEHVLSAVAPLSKMLQKKTCDLVVTVTETRAVVALLEAERGDAEVWNVLFDKAVNLANQVGVEPSIPRPAGLQRNRPNVPAVTPSDFWRRNMYLPFVDHLISDIQIRLLQGEARYNAQYLIPTQVDNLTAEIIGNIHETFLPDIEPDLDLFVREVKRWQARWFAVRPEPKPDTLEKAVELSSPDLYPNVRMCLEVLLAMPDSTATAERSFSTMRRVKTYLRNTMTTERMSGLGLLNIYREREINVEEVVDIFARRKERRLALLFRV